MAVRNEQSNIAASLGAVLEQDYPAERLEIVVADGESDDATLAVIAALPGAERVHVLHNPRRLQGAGLNLAIRASRGEVLIRVDGHAIIAPDYVRACLNALAQTGAMNVGGPMIPQGLTATGRAIAAATRSRFGVPAAFHVSRRARFTDTVYLGAWPRETFLRVGLFDETLVANEDYEHNYRIRRAGGRIYLSPAIRSRYIGRQTASELARQYYRYGRGKARMLQRHPASLRARHLLAPAFVLFLALGPLAAAFAPLRVAWLALLAAYAALALGFAAAAARALRPAEGARVLLVFPLIHLSWGTGAWAEAARMTREWLAPRRAAGARRAAAHE